MSPVDVSKNDASSAVSKPIFKPGSKRLATRMLLSGLSVSVAPVPATSAFGKKSGPIPTAKSLSVPKSVGKPRKAQIRKTK